MATTTVEKKQSRYGLEIQQEVIGKYKNANRWFWSAFRRQPLMYGLAFALLVTSTYLTTKTIALVGDVLDVLLFDINLHFVPSKTRDSPQRLIAGRPGFGNRSVFVFFKPCFEFFRLLPNIFL